jgi:hypothetical protein
MADDGVQNQLTLAVRVDKVLKGTRAPTSWSCKDVSIILCGLNTRLSERTTHPDNWNLASSLLNVTSRLSINCTKSLNYWWHCPRLKSVSWGCPVRKHMQLLEALSVVMNVGRLLLLRQFAKRVNFIRQHTNTVPTHLVLSVSWRSVVRGGPWDSGNFRKLLFDLSCVFTSTMTLSNIQRAYRCTEPMDLATVTSVNLLLCCFD